MFLKNRNHWGWLCPNILTNPISAKSCSVYVFLTMVNTSLQITTLWSVEANKPLQNPTIRHMFSKSCQFGEDYKNLLQTRTQRLRLKFFCTQKDSLIRQGITHVQPPNRSHFDNNSTGKSQGFVPRVNDKCTVSSTELVGKANMDR